MGTLDIFGITQLFANMQRYAVNQFVYPAIKIKKTVFFYADAGGTLLNGDIEVRFYLTLFNLMSEECIMPLRSGGRPELDVFIITLHLLSPVNPSVLNHLQATARRSLRQFL